MNNSPGPGGRFSWFRKRGFFALRHTEESGFTIVELVISMALLAIVAAPLAGVFWSAIRTAGSAAHRTDGSSVASREIEAMRAVPYAQVGFYDDQSPALPPGAPVGTTSVSLGATSPAPGNPGSPLIQPLTPDPNAASGYAPDPNPNNANPVTYGGVIFNVQRYVVWSDAKDPTQNYSNAYKKLTVIVTWTDQAGSHIAREDSLLYPGGLGVYAGPDGGPGASTTTTAPVFQPATPVLADIVLFAPPNDETQVPLNWTQPPGGGAVTSYAIEYSTSSSFPPGNFTVINPLPANLRSYPVPNLTPATTYYFEVIAYSSSASSTSAWKSITTAPLSGSQCTLGSLNIAGTNSLSTTGTILKNNGQMSENLTLSWTTSGPCTDSYEVHASDPLGSTDPGSPFALGGSAGVYTGIVNSNSKNWAIGLHTFNVWDITTSQPTPVVKTFKVCVYGVPSC
jgi:prepilin-type N-terminal cleavage/methylation domain-containing protein